MRREILGMAMAVFGLCGPAHAQQAVPAANPMPATAAKPFDELGSESGVAVFEKHCASCHGNHANAPNAPDPATLRQLPPEKILDALTDGVMKIQGQSISDEMKRRVAEYLGGRPIGSATQGDIKTMAGRCASNPAMSDPAATPSWNGWGAGPDNTRFQTAKDAGLTADQVPKLKLKWSFGFPTGVSAYSQPSVVSGRVFTGSDIGYVYSLDAATGCSYWSFQAKGGVRPAISVGPVKHGTSRFAAYFGDAKANVYAVDAQTGELLWTVKVDDHFTARITGSPSLFEGRLYVPVSASEEFTASSPGYECCTARGSVVALDANTGKEIWKSYVIPEAPKPTRKNAQGTQLWAPAGGSIWNAPTIDPKRHALYVGTGDTETEPAAKAADSVMALDLATGKMLWAHQATVGDTYIGGCSGPTKSDACPSKVGPDFDIGNSPILRTLPDDDRIVVAGTKDATVFAVDPDHNGRLVWKTTVADRPGQSGLWGIVFGGSADEDYAYYPLVRGGMVAVSLVTGEKKWFTTLSPEDQHVSYSAAATAIPGVVFVGGSDGKLYGVASADGRHLWEYDTIHDYQTVNQVPAKGGSMNGPGPVVAGGMLFVGSGYSVVTGTAGNALLAFSAE